MVLHDILLPSVASSSMISSAQYYQIPPIFRLPVETFSRIFEFGTYNFGDEDVDNVMSNLDFDLLNFPIRVAAVSKRFRAIAHSTPSLWTTLYFNFPRPASYDPKSPAQLEHDDHDYSRDCLWLTRSRACALDVILCYRDPAWNFAEEHHYFRREHMERILSLLESHAWRIRRFTLICDTFAPIHASLEFFSRQGDTMRKLNILELYRCNEYVAEYPRFYPPRYAKPVALPLNHAPLRRIILAGVHIDWDHYCKSEALRHLNTLDISYHSQDTRPSLDAFIRTLRASPDLKSLSVIGSGPLVLQSNPTYGITHSESASEGIVISDNPQCVLSKSPLPLSFRHLSVLKVGFYQINDAILILSLIFNMSFSGTLTDLTLKDLSQPSETNPVPGSTLLTFLTSLCDRRHILDRTVWESELPQRRSGAPSREISSPFLTTLRHLTLECIKATEKAFTGLLNISPTLETLALDGVSSCILLALCPLTMPHTARSNETNRPDCYSPLPCSSLKTLSLRFLDLPKERIISYTALAKSRAAAGVPLGRLVVDRRDLTLGFGEKDVMAAKEYVIEDVEIIGSEDEPCDGAEEEDPYAPGGAFNDPEFDALFLNEV